MVTDILVELYDPKYVRLFVRLEEEWNLQSKEDTRGALPARILDADARIKKLECKFRQTCDLRTRVAKCIEFDGGIFEHLLW